MWKRGVIRKLFIFALSGESLVEDRDWKHESSMRDFHIKDKIEGYIQDWQCFVNPDKAL